MANFAERFLNMMTLNNDANDDDYDEYEEEYEEVDDTQEPEDEDIYEEEEEEEEPVSSYQQTSRQESREEKQPILNFRHRERETEERETTETQKRVIPFQGRREGESEIVKVIKPQEFNEAEKIVQELKAGKTIVVNLEGLEVSQAQRIMDFVGGASYIIDGSLNAISNNIFIAAPDNIEVSGDLKSEIVNRDILSPELG